MFVTSGRLKKTFREPDGYRGVKGRIKRDAEPEKGVESALKSLGLDTSSRYIHPLLSGLSSRLWTRGEISPGMNL